MDPVRATRWTAQALCAFMAVVQVALQYGFGPNRAPAGLFLLFTGLWIFGFAMLRLAPWFGAAGTAAWGLIAALGAWRMDHSWLLVGGSLAVAAAALANLAALARRRQA
ncbi:MAG TPA: hypothetical protein VHH36_05120 [Candidatus Thermoplasmatota archaeon]|nr:hypothetical protein [Candidatus Thermoplasmatota archaeon]